MARIGDGGDLLKCSFCGKSQKQVKKLIAGPGVYICDECVDLCNEIIEEELSEPGEAAKTQEAKAGEPPSLIDRLGRNLTKLAAEGKLGPVIGRDREIERVMQVLVRRSPGSPVLVGEPGVGKTTVVDGLALKIVSGDVASPFRDKMVYRVGMSALIAGSTDPAFIKTTFLAALKEARDRRDVILFLDELRGRPAEVWEALAPLLVTGQVRVIGALTADQYARRLSEYPNLERVLVPVQVGELTEADTMEVLKASRERYQSYHHVAITDGALAAIARFTRDQVSPQPRPAKAIDLLDEAASLGAMRGLAEVDEALVVATVAGAIGVPPEEVTNAPRFTPAAMTPENREIWAIS